MIFKELMDRYKNGIASDEEKKLVEEELEKYEAIEDYLAEMIDLNFTSSLVDEQYKEESMKLKRSVNTRLRKVVFTSVAIVMSIVLAVFFIISPLIDSFFYNPTKVTVGDTDYDIDFDMDALTELNLPGYALSSQIHVDKLGFGNYDISYSRTNLFTQETNHVYSKIKRGHNITNHTKFVDDNYFNFTSIRYPDGISSQQIVEQKERVMNHIRQLSPVSYISSWLTFENDMTMEDLHQLKLKYPNVDFVWSGVRTAPHNEGIHDLLGFSMRFGTGILSVDKPDAEKYPAFDILEWLVNPTYDGGEMYLEPKGYELHFKDLLKYLVDRKEAVNVLDKHPRKYEYYKQAFDYVEKHGVKSFGVLVYSEAQDLIELLENEPIKTLELNQVLASKRYIN